MNYHGSGYSSVSQKLGGAKNTTEGRWLTKWKFVFPEPRLEGENLSKNITYFACVTVSTVKENVKDTGKDINNIYYYYYFSSLTPSGVER